jgi:hypothetical protein
MFVSLESSARATLPTMAKKTSKASKSKAPDAGQAERLVRLRKALGYPTASAFAKFLNVGQQRWANFENGFPLSREIIFLLVRSVPGLTSDWLYFGKSDGLPVDLARRLGELGPPGNRKTA